jgi:hypothetical protein
MGAVFCALPVKDTSHPREPRTNHPNRTSRERKRGLVQAPFFLRTDPPKPETQSRLGSGHPGKPIFCNSVAIGGEQTVCQRVIGYSQPSTRMKLRELASFQCQPSQRRRLPPTKSHRQNRTYIHSLGETSLLRRCDTRILPSRNGILYGCVTPM